ncbi:MAG: DUF5059 domain-containing protein [Haloarculaceae archaeon]
MQTRRDLISVIGLTASGALAGCRALVGSETPTDGGGDGAGTADGNDGAGTPGVGSDDGGQASSTPAHSVGPETAVATGYLTYRGQARDAVALGRAGAGEAGAAVAEAAFARFERATGEYGAHEALEHADGRAYETFEGGLTDLEDALAGGDQNAADDTATTVGGALSGVQETLAGTGTARAIDLLAVGERATNAVFLAAAGAGDAAATVLRDARAAFAATPAHDALEDANGDAYERLEDALDAAVDAADAGNASAVREQSRAALAATVDGAYALAPERAAHAAHLATMGTRALDAAAATRLDGVADAATLVEDVFASFEGAAVHDALEDADHDAYEAFEGALGAYADALADGSTDGLGDVLAAVTAGQFALVGAAGDAPAGRADGGSEDGGTVTGLTGGPNVVDGIPDEADHVVAVQSVSFAPAELSVSVGDTVAFRHVGGESHTVTARGDGLPDGAAYWASGGFETEAAARDGWARGEGAVRAGQSYVHTFETPGEHPYFCIPHEAAGMAGTIVVEE